ncbi:hypothetical protein RRG08_052384, partial [Elysia crispata]
RLLGVTVAPAKKEQNVIRREKTSMITGGPGCPVARGLYPGKISSLGYQVSTRVRSAHLVIRSLPGSLPGEDQLTWLLGLYPGPYPGKISSLDCQVSNRVSSAYLIVRPLPGISRLDFQVLIRIRSTDLIARLYPRLYPSKISSRDCQAPTRVRSAYFIVRSLPGEDQLTRLSGLYPGFSTPSKISWDSWLSGLYPGKIRLLGYMVSTRISSLGYPISTRVSSAHMIVRSLPALDQLTWLSGLYPGPYPGKISSLGYQVSTRVRSVHLVIRSLPALDQLTWLSGLYPGKISSLGYQVSTRVRSAHLVIRSLPG